MSMRNNTQFTSSSQSGALKAQLITVLSPFFKEFGFYAVFSNQVDLQ